ncbi:sulfite exporter TauE/SafE family protein [Rubripirellula reticaptiva]|uniref:Urease accessory protein UreH-like transmembrane domain-containing protein n=1 Tax=Rubripirellula reticaptiva TaxID=2528013 RepID=A0A5C6F1M1_9BACT|nr:sulfite exporter TauE/SafE family protein [Rubripirellula reticaptiva]TWU55248.1 hypothetical protein Poly59_15450 [Rubripirellula reticaptiva]
MWILITAVVTASLLGSMHCVGMCGPLAMWASGIGDKAPRRTVVMSTAMYHVGRMLTYVLAGLIAGGIGSAIDVGGSWIGIQVAAARVVGGLMVIVGALKLWTLIRGQSKEAHPPKPSRIGGVLVKMRPYLFRLPPVSRALATGLLTTLLPCGWLYLFALFAAGTASPVMGAVVMFAFWVGTVPALTALVAGSLWLSRRFTMVIPAAAAVLLITTGCFTASGRGFANLESLAALRASVNLGDAGLDPLSLVDHVNDSAAKPLPCCCEGEKTCDAEVAVP